MLIPNHKELTNISGLAFLSWQLLTTLAVKRGRPSGGLLFSVRSLPSEDIRTTLGGEDYAVRAYRAGEDYAVLLYCLKLNNHRNAYQLIFSLPLYQ